MVFGAPHALCRQHHAERGDADGSGRGHRRVARQARLPAHPRRQRPWRQRRRHRRARLDARSQALRRGAHRGAHLFPAGAPGDRRAKAVRARRHGPCLRVRDRDDPAHQAGAGEDGAGGDHLSRPGSRYLTTDLLGASAVRAYHDFGDLSPSGTLGDPTLATPEKGAAFFAAVARELAAFVEDFRGWAIPERVE